MSARVESSPVSVIKQERKKKHLPTALKVLLALLMPVLVAVASLYYYGVVLHNDDRIYYNISISGVDVSGLTRHEAVAVLGLDAYSKRGADSVVTMVFPDDSTFVITGSDAGLTNDAHDLVYRAYSIGRGRGIMLDALSHLLRYEAQEVNFEIKHYLDTGMLYSAVEEFTNDFNRRLDESVPQIYDDRIVYTKGAGHVNINTDELFELVYAGLFESFENEVPVDMAFILPEPKFVDDILEIRSSIFVQMVSSEFEPLTESATPSVVGVDFDILEAASLVRDTEVGKTATFYKVFTHPEYTQGQLNDLLFRDLIGQRSTSAGGASGRLHNIELSSALINGTVLLPGEEFSFDEVVGPRTAALGYRSAAVIINGEVTTGIGGGICQVSSTLYAAIRPSALQITERHPHSRPIDYLPVGWDAAVFWGLLDFRFVNNTDYPIRIEMELDGRNFTARVYGTIIDDFPRAADWNS